MVLHPDISRPVALINALSTERFSYGAYALTPLRCFSTIYDTPQFLDAVRNDVNNAVADRPAIVWLLIKLATQSQKVRQDPAVLELAQLLKHAAGATELETLLGRTADGDGAVASPFDSLEAPKGAMRPPGCRDHDNDRENFRDVCIVPTAAELRCPEEPYLPPLGGSPFIASKQASVLDWHFRLLREDLV